jgi:hypothetical protein
VQKVNSVVMFHHHPNFFKAFLVWSRIYSDDP